jgi:hypothetical protein
MHLNFVILIFKSRSSQLPCAANSHFLILCQYIQSESINPGPIPSAHREARARTGMEQRAAHFAKEGTTSGLTILTDFTKRSCKVVGIRASY